MRFPGSHYTYTTLPRVFILLSSLSSLITNSTPGLRTTNPHSLNSFSPSPHPPQPHSQGHRVLLADLRGFGESSAGFLTYTPLNVSADIIAILRYLGIAKPVILVANSLSGCDSSSINQHHKSLCVTHSGASFPVTDRTSV